MYISTSISSIAPGGYTSAENASLILTLFAFAHAFYKDASFIILDKPTAALDPVAEMEVYGKMNEIARDKTAVFISHRLSSCRFCDDIAVFHKGELIQRGNHEALVADKNGKYYEL